MTQRRFNSTPIAGIRSRDLRTPGHSERSARRIAGESADSAAVGVRREGDPSLRSG